MLRSRLILECARKCAPCSHCQYRTGRGRDRAIGYSGDSQNGSQESQKRKGKSLYEKLHARGRGFKIAKMAKRSP